MIQAFLTKLSPKEKKILYVAVVFVLVAFLDRFFFGPALSHLSSLDEDIEKQKNVIKRDLRFLSYKNKVIQENEDLSKYFTSDFQTEEKIISIFLKRVEILASDAGINLIKISPSATQQKRGYVEYYANLECDGPLDKLATFMYLIDTSEDLLKIVKISVNPKRASAGEVTAAMMLKKIIIGADTGLSEGGQGGIEGVFGAGGVDGVGGAGEGEAYNGMVTSEAGEKTEGGKKASGEMSERFTPKVKTSEDAEAQSLPEDAEEYEIKPSIFERMLSK